MGTAIRRLLTAAFLFLAALLPVTPLLRLHAWPDSHEGARYILLLDRFREAFLHGEWYPRWLPDAYAGYGYPTFVFYQPAYFFGAMPFSFLPGYPLYTARLYLYCLSLLGTVGAFLLARRLGEGATGRKDGWLAGLFGTALFVLTPYIYCNVYVRGALAEYMAMMLTPWALYLLCALHERVRDGRPLVLVLAGLSVSIAMVIYAHPFTAVFLLMIIAFLGLFLAWRAGPRGLEFLGLTGVACCCGLGLSAPFLMTAVQMKRAVWHPMIYAPTERHAVHLGQMVTREWGFGFSLEIPQPDGMPYQLGLPHLLLALAGAYAARTLRLIRGTAWCYAGLVLLMTPLAWEAWQKIGVLRVVQFPWRILSATAVLQVMLGASLIPMLQRRLKPRLLLFGMVGSLLLVAWWQAPQFQARPGVDAAVELGKHRATLLSNFNSYSAGDEFRPVGASTNLPLVRDKGEMVLVDPAAHKAGAVVSLAPGSDQYRILASVNSPVAAKVTINQFYFPGWKVRVNGEPVADSRLRTEIAKDGRLSLSVPAGATELSAHYGGPPGANGRTAVVVLSICILALGPLWQPLVRRGSEMLPWRRREPT